MFDDTPPIGPTPRPRRQSSASRTKAPDPFPPNGDVPALPPADPAPPTGRKSRAPSTRKPKVTAAVAEIVVPPPEPPPPQPAVSLPPADEVARVTADVRSAGESLAALTARREELLASLGAIETRLADLRQQASVQQEVLRAEFEEVVGAARAEVEAARTGAADLRREATSATEAFRGVGDLLDTARSGLEAAKRSAAEADAAAVSAGERAAGATAAAADARGELDALRGEFGTLAADARRTLDEFRSALEATREAPPAPAAVAVVPAAEPEPPAPPAPTPTADSLPEIVEVPADERAEDARDHLVRYLNDLLAVGEEQNGLFQALADAAADPELRSEFELRRATVQDHRRQLEERVRAHGGSPGGGRGLLGQLATRLWDALQAHRGGAGDTVEGVVQAASAVGIAADLGRAVHALARAVGDGETAALAAAHVRGQEAFAGRLRGRIAPLAAGAARRRADA